MTGEVFDPTALAEQLLIREPIEADTSDIARFLAGKRVLVTGAGGSIGTPLAEMLVDLGSPGLVLLDHHENSLFHLRQRLLEHGRTPNASFLLADIRDRRKLSSVLRDHQPEVIFHLAAYKHVPLAEESPEQCVSNNILGAWYLFQEAQAAGVEKVVYPSTDKAVRPVNIYGATKRVVEEMLRVLSGSQGGTSLSAIRLVNVLGAHGGVIETFARQIREGHPLTVTDPGMTRYWISMREALYLLTSAAYSPASGNILILDIGEPVKVVSIAQRLWEIAGPRNEAFAVEYIGARPGERMTEYLYGDDEYAEPSGLPHLLQIHGKKSPARDLNAVACLMAEFENLVAENAREPLMELLYGSVPGER